MVGFGLSLYGWIVAPFTAAIYLALRMRPRPQRRAVLVPLVAAALVILSLALLLLLPGTAGAAGGVPAPLASVVRC